jgi:hypothetical protein
MKKITLFLMAFVCTYASFSQSCAKVTSGFFTQTGPTTQSLTLTYTANGTKAFDLKVRCGTTVILDTCIRISGNGSVVIPNLMCGGGVAALSAVARGRAGNCNAAVCDSLKVNPPSGGPLPVSFKSFVGKRTGNTVSLTWQTELEINTKQFILERKSGNGFTEVTSVDASNIASGGRYNFTDNNVSKGISQYRIRIVSTDGSFSFSNVIGVKGLSTASDFTIFPNPTTGDAKITITDLNESTEIQVIDMSGRAIRNISISNNNNIQLSGLQKGIYMIRLVNKNGGEAVTKKLTVIN